MSEHKVTYKGGSWVGLLGVLFVALKLTGYITWSWWWVTLPFWGVLALGILIGIVLTLIDELF